MIDSIKIEIPKHIDLDIIPNYTMRVSSSGEVFYYTGKIGPLDVIINPRLNITRISGSIRKYYFGNNELGDLSFSQLSKALNNLRLQLRLDISVILTPLQG